MIEGRPKGSNAVEGNVADVSRRRGAAVALRAVGAGALVGSVVGVLTVVGQKLLPDTVVGVANSAAVWGLVAFVAGMLVASDGVAAPAGTAVLVGAVAGYYASVPILVEGAAANERSIAIWGLTALAAGPVMGLSGRWWRSPEVRRRLPAIAVVGGLFAVEGVRRLVGDPPDVALGWAMIAVAVAIPLAGARSVRERAVALAATVVAALLLAGLFELIEAAFLA